MAKNKWRHQMGKRDKYQAINRKKRKGKERKGKERKGKERKGKERKGKERKGKERKGKERKGKERTKVQGMTSTYLYREKDVGVCDNFVAKEDRQTETKKRPILQDQCGEDGPDIRAAPPAIRTGISRVLHWVIICLIGEGRLTLSARGYARFTRFCRREYQSELHQAPGPEGQRGVDQFDLRKHPFVLRKECIHCMCWRKVMMNVIASSNSKRCERRKKGVTFYSGDYSMALQFTITSTTVLQKIGLRRNWFSK